MTHEWFWVWHHVWEGVIWSSRAPVLAAGALWLWMFGHVMEVVVAKVEILLVLFKKMRKKKSYWVSRAPHIAPVALPMLLCCCLATACLICGDEVCGGGHLSSVLIVFVVLSTVINRLVKKKEEEKKRKKKKPQDLLTGS